MAVGQAHLAAGVTAPGKFSQTFLEYPHDPPEWTSQRRDFIFCRPVETDAGGKLTLSDDRPNLALELGEERLKVNPEPPPNFQTYC